MPRLRDIFGPTKLYPFTTNNDYDIHNPHKDSQQRDVQLKINEEKSTVKLGEQDSNSVEHGREADLVGIISINQCAFFGICNFMEFER